MSHPPPFRPARLSKEALEVPLPGFLARADLPEAQRVQAQAVATRRRLAAFGPRTQRRLLRGALGGAAVCAILGWLFLASSLGAFALFALLGALAGTAVGGLGLGMTLSGLLFGAVAVVGCAAVLGSRGVLGPPGIAKVVFFALIGAVFSVGEAAQRSDGD